MSILQFILTEIKASEAYREHDAIKTVIDGKRDVGYEAMIAGPPYDNSEWPLVRKMIDDAGLGIIELPRHNGEAIIYHRNTPIARRKAKRLAQIAMKHDTYLADETSEEAREIGKLLGYDDADIEEFVNRVYKKELAMSEKVKGADGKACWKGYRYAGTEDGKDKCVKIGERVIYQNESLGIEIVESDKPFPILEAEYQGRDVELGQVKRGGNKKFYVYVKDPKTKNVKKVSFGDTTGLSIKTKDPERRKSFRARHNCDNPGPKTKARYWSCRMWSGPDAVEKMLK